MRLAPLVLLALAAPATARDRIPAGHTVGTPIDCINVHQIQTTTRPDDRTILFRMSGNHYYLNTLPQTCPRLSGIGTAISYRLTTSQLCNVDIVHVIQVGGGIGEIGACSLGKFTPWERDKR